MYTKIFKLGLARILLSGSALIHAEVSGSGTVSVDLMSGGQAVANTSVIVNSLVIASFDGKSVSDQNGHVQVTNVPVGQFEVIVLDSAGNTIATQSGELITNNEEVTIAINL